MLMHDYARCHIAPVSTIYLADVSLPKMQWPPFNSDLNPIVHVWDVLKQAVRSRNPTLGSIMEMRAVLTDDWEAIPQNNLIKVIIFMRNLLESAIRTRGGKT